MSLLLLLYFMFIIYYFCTLYFTFVTFILFLCFQLFFIYNREVYHTKRMQRIVSVVYSADSKFVLSGSDEMNIRLWKATAWEKLGPVI